LAFALDEFFNVLDVLYLERDGITTVAPRNDCPSGFNGFDGTSGNTDENVKN